MKPRTFLFSLLHFPQGHTALYFIFYVSVLSPHLDLVPQGQIFFLSLSRPDTSIILLHK